ncbi:MAG: hypothetical protein AB1422_02170 [bacterium]
MEQNLVQLFKTRWEEVKEIEKMELQNTPFQEKFLHLIQLFSFGNKLGFKTEEDETVDKVRARWGYLKEIWCEKDKST